MHSTHVLSLAWSCISVWVFTSCVVPQDGDTPPLLHIGQLTAGPEHCTGPDESANKQKQKHKPRQQSWAPSPQNKLNIPMLHFLKSALTDQTTTKKNKKLSLYIKLQLVHMMARLNTKSEYILCTVYGVSVRVCTYAALFQTMTSLSSPPDARYRPLLDQRTQLTQAAVQNTKHHKLIVLSNVSWSR